MTDKSLEEAATLAAKRFEHFAGDYAASDCEYSTPEKPGNNYSQELHGESGFNAVIIEAFKAGAKWREENPKRIEPCNACGISYADYAYPPKEEPPK